MEEERLAFPLSSGVDDSPAITAVDRMWIERQVLALIVRNPVYLLFRKYCWKKGAGKKE